MKSARLDSLRRTARDTVRAIGKRIVLPVTHLLGRRGRQYYFEDFVRVYPGGVAFTRFGRRRETTSDDVKNFKNHTKFYVFAAQFASGKVVVDAGCGSGYGCKILRNAGADEVLAFDASEHALRFASKHFGEYASFSLQTITDLNYPDGTAHLVVCSEVLEHVREYDAEDHALSELERILRPGGLLVAGTPNSELLGSHGFSFEELDALVAGRFRSHVILENALVPFDPEARLAWEGRLASGRIGVLPSTEIDLSETIVPEGAHAELKQGGPARILAVGDHEVDTSRLHNTHSFIVLAIAH
jgi:2-polyprenyl-3-methyl-5-hydroxy-6-metoxy-1,4-benzoquinol methylase